MTWKGVIRMIGDTWDMWALEREGYFWDIGDQWYATQHRSSTADGELVEVVVEEVPQGDSTYWGWLAHSWGVWEDEPSMIQWHPGMFRMQFAYGPKADEDKGNGRIVHLKITRKVV